MATGMADDFTEAREAVHGVTGFWWLWLVSGAAWIFVSVIVLQFDQASIKLEALGFQISTVGSFRLSDRVHQQSPAALTMAPRGSTVTISR